MNAPTRAVELAEPKIELIPCGAIAPSETQIQALRRKRYDMESLKDLAGSIAKLGVQQPGVVRKLPAMRGLASYELVAGERRWRASRLADVAHFPAIIRVLTDAEVLEIQLVENLQREELHELEEAVGYEELMKVGQLSAEEVGERVSKSRSWVYSRLSLLKLEGPAREALEKGEIDVSRALVVARVVDPEDRARAMALALEKRWNGEGFQLSVRDLQAELNRKRITMHLGAAPFDTAKVSYFRFGPKDSRGMQEPIALPACGQCPKRSGNSDPDAEDPDICTDTGCFDTKAKLAAEHRREAAAKSEQPVIRGTEAQKIAPTKKVLIGYVDLDSVCKDDEYPEPEPEASGDDDADNAAFGAWDARSRAWQPRTYRVLLKDHAIEPVLIEIPGTRKVIEAIPVKVARDLLKKVDVKLSGSVGTKPPPAPKRVDYQDQHRKYEEQRKKQQEEEKRALAFRGKVLEAMLPKMGGALTDDEVRELAIQFVDDDWSSKQAIKTAFGKQVAQQLGNLKASDFARAVRVALYCSCVGSAHIQPKAMLALAKRLKVNVDQLQKAFDAEEKKAVKK